MQSLSTSMAPVALAQHSSDSLDFSLWWDRATNRLWVDVLAAAIERELPAPF